MPTRLFRSSILSFASLASAALLCAASSTPPETLPQINRPARAKQLRDEAAKVAEQIKPLNEILKPFDAKAAALREQSAQWSTQAAGYDAEATQLERSGQGLQDPAPKVQAAAGNLRNAANTIRTMQPAIAGALGGNQSGKADDVVRAAGIDLPGLAASLDQCAQALAGNDTPDKLQTEIDRLDTSVLKPLQASLLRVRKTHDDYDRHYRTFDAAVAKKNAEIAYWQGEREKHHANMEEAERRCAASAKVVLGVSICTDLASKAWFIQAQTGAAQADIAIGLAQTDIAMTESQRIGDRISMSLASFADKFINDQISGVDRQIQPLRDARATLLALRDSAAKQPLAKEKRDLATAAKTKAAALRTELAGVYTPVADRVKERDALTTRRNSLLRQADLIERPPVRGSGKLG